ncbi:MAG TPA: AraC family transcriptional regulator [Burkholderiaceae bacterium]|nr:AraC family transcriptional regulator [Burkholderiaceae bacterium]
MQRRGPMDEEKTAVVALRFAPGANVVAIQLAAALHPRKFAPPVNLVGAMRLCVLLVDGQASIGGAQQQIEISGPSLVWVPVSVGLHLRVEPGAQGHLLWVLDAFANEALGNDAASSQLREMLDRPMTACALQSDEVLAELQRAFEAVDRETRRNAGGSQLYLRAQLAVLMVLAWRLCGLEDVAVRGCGAESNVLLRFRHLVELHFRDHWAIAHYARSLGISHDRLYDTCTRTLKRTPLQLLHERLAREAGQRLSRSAFSIEQIASDLGFRTTSYFNRFFRRQTGTSPGQYRRQSLGAGAQADGASLGGFADWP